MKRALIVDDSRLARTVLGRLLTEHGVAADAAESAEVALEYLKHHRPDVVFLDHNMPGIDGFQALEAIKTNPATATIPVMMYTSQEGELYVGQARALGALGVLPKTLQHVEVVKVLRTLRLIPGPATEPPASTAAATPAAPAFDVQPLDAARLRELLEPLFSEHTTSLREEMRRGLQRLAAAPPPLPPAAATPVPSELPRQRRSGRLLPLVNALLAVTCATFAYLYFATSSALDEANQRALRLANDTATLSDARFATLASAAAPRPATDSVLDSLEWAANRGNRYAFDAVPLDDERAAMLTSLLAQLDGLGFAGTVAIDIHSGRFCMNYGSDGTLGLAPPDQPAAMCEQTGWPENEAVALGQRQSLAFANAVASAAARNPRVRVETVAHGSSSPVLDYPTVNYELTAGAWNRAATANHRVEVSLIADPADTGARR